MFRIKRDSGVRTGALIEGYDGILDRLNSMAFATPTFFHSCGTGGLL